MAHRIDQGELHDPANGAIDARDRVVALWVEARGRKAETAA